MYQDILLHIQQYVPLTQEEQDTICGLLVSKQYAKKSMLLREGEICNFEGYLVKGCCRTFYVNEEGQEITLQFAVENWWVSDNASFQDHTPSRLFIEAMEDCELLIFTPSSKEKMFTEVPIMERYYRIIVQRHMAALQNRILNNISLNATARYLDFVQTFPNLPNRVPQYYIASYLGMSAEFVSKIRKKLAQ